MKHELLTAELHGINLVAEQLDGELLIKVIKHFNIIKDDSINNARVFSRLKFIYEKRFGMTLQLS